MQSTVDQLFNSLTVAVPELKAAILISADGRIKCHAAEGFDIDVESFAAEYAALFRIARRTAEDTAMGEALEQILLCDKTTLIARRYGSDNVAVFVCDSAQQLGRLRYELRCFAEQLVNRVV